MIDFGIIAAGEGNRIKEEGACFPKPLIKIEGKPMIERLITLMENAGAGSVSVIINSDMPEVWDFLQKLIPTTKCELKIISKRTPSSMHSFYELINFMKPDDKFVVTTVDTIFRDNVLNDYSDFFENNSKNIDGLMGVTTYIDDEKPLYIDTDDKNNILRFSDYPNTEVSAQQFISAGIYGLKQTSIPILEKCIQEGVSRMRNFQRKLVENGLELKIYNFGKVLDIDHISDIDKANAFLCNK